jgi:hypothetical protein
MNSRQLNRIKGVLEQPLVLVLEVINFLQSVYTLYPRKRVKDQASLENLGQRANFQALHQLKIPHSMPLPKEEGFCQIAQLHRTGTKKTTLLMSLEITKSRTVSVYQPLHL